MSDGAVHVINSAHTQGQERRIVCGGPREEIVGVIQATKLGPYPTMLCLTRRDDPEDGQNPLHVLGDYPLRARVSFGLGLASEQVEFDWLNGVTVAIPTGDDVLVQCVSPVVSASVPLLRQFVGVMISPAHMISGGPLAQARLTEQPRAIASTVTSQIYRVPARAHAVRLFTTTPAFYGSYSVNFLSAPISGKAPNYRATPSNADEFPLGAGIRGVTVLNNGPDADITLQWSIAL